MKSKAITGIVLALFLIGTLTLALKIQPVRASGTIYIRADGSIDGPANITTVDYVTYYFNESNYDEIVVERDNIVVDGAGYTLQGTGAWGSQGIYMFGRSNVTIRNTNIKGFYDGIYLILTSKNVISGNNITSYNIGILLSASSSNSISGNNITNNEWYGIWLRDSSNNSVYGNNLINNIGIDNIGIGLWESSNNTISGNIFIGCGLQVVHPSYDNVVSDNLVNGKPLVYLEGVSDYTVDHAGQVILVKCESIRVENLNLSNATIGLELSETDNTEIVNNSITNNGDGIYLYESSNNSIVGNNITANNFYGIHLGVSYNNTIFGNSITNNGLGIYVFKSSNNSIYGNNFTDNYWGIGIAYSSNNTLSGNNIRNNEVGIHLLNSSDNFVYHNNFIDNTQQVYVETSGYANFWDDGYPSGGNYWSNYTDVDEKSGPYQNETGSDGIWDHPYIIDENNQDNYPLVPEFPTWTSMLLILTVLTVATAIYKRRLLKTPIH